MNRRGFLGLALAGAAQAKLPKLTIKRIRYYLSPGDAAGRVTKIPGQFNQSANIVTVETEAGITGIGEGGSKDTVEQCAAMLIGEDAARTEHLWQMMFRGYFYPAGREKLHALGAIDVALWDIKGKALGVPVHQLLGGPVRDHIECYSTGFPSKGSVRETARACIEAGYRAYRTGGLESRPFDRFENVLKLAEHCKEIREGVGKDGAWAIDYHTRFDMPDAVNLSRLIEPLGPYFVEDLVRSENPALYRTLRQQVKVPIAVGEQFGARWDINELVENHLIDYARVTIPNVGGITEFQKIAALCETHDVGLIPHFTGPLSEAAIVHACAVFPGQALMEMLPRATGGFAHLPECFDFKNGKMWPNDRPGLGVTFDASKFQLVSEITEKTAPIPQLRRPDGSYTNW